MCRVTLLGQLRSMETLLTCGSDEDVLVGRVDVEHEHALVLEAGDVAELVGVEGLGAGDLDVLHAQEG